MEAIFEHRWSGPTECAKPVEIGIRQKIQIFLKVLNTLLPAGAADLIASRIPPGLVIGSMYKSSTDYRNAKST